MMLITGGALAPDRTDRRLGVGRQPCKRRRPFSPATANCRKRKHQRSASDASKLVSEGGPRRIPLSSSDALPIRWPYGALAAIALAGAVLIWWTMSHGPGVSPDSAIYLGIAQSVRSGSGFLMDGMPVTHFPPGYPLLLAAATVVDRNLLDAARLVAALFFGINTFLVGMAAYVAAGRRFRVAVVAVLLFTVSGPVLNLHAMAWSEAPFFCCVMGGLLALATWLSTSDRRYLIGAATAFGIAIVFRYAGLPLFLPLCVATLALSGAAWRRRILDTVLASMIVAVPLAIWLVHNALGSRQATDRVLAVHLVSRDALFQMLATLSGFFFDGVSNPLVQGLIVIALAAVLLMAIRHGRQSVPAGARSWTLPLLGVVWVGGYVVFLLVSISLADATTPLDERILFPAFGVVAVCLPVALSEVSRRLNRPAIWWGVVAVALVSVATRAAAAIQVVGDIHRTGEGFVADDWQLSDLMDAVRRLPATTAVYSNSQDAIEFVLHRPAAWLPDPLIWESMQPNPEYERYRSAMCAQLAAGGVIAFFTTEGTGDAWQQGEAAAMCPGSAVEQHADGVLLRASASPASDH